MYVSYMVKYNDSYYTDLKKHKHTTHTQLLTVDKLLLFLGTDADQVGIKLLTALLSLKPSISLCKVKVAAAHELQPALSTALYN